MKAHKIWKRGLALALSLALFLTMVPAAFATEGEMASTARTPNEAVAEMTWGVNLVDLYIADIQPEEGATTGYDDFQLIAELGMAVWFWNDTFEWLTYHDGYRGTFTVSTTVPTYGSGTDTGRPLISLGFFAKEPGQHFDVTLSDSKIVNSNGETIVTLTALDGNYQGNASTEPDDNRWYTYALWNLTGLPEENTAYDGATLQTTVTINGGYTTISKAEYYYEYQRSHIDEKKLIDEYMAQGVNVFRLPVTWTWFVDDQTFAIDTEWLAKVKGTVDYIISKGAYCILDMHNDYMKRSFVATKDSNGNWTNFKWTQDWMTGGYYNSSGDNYNGDWKATPYDDYVNERFAAVWTQIANYFKDCDHKLIFEAFNEPAELWYEGVNYYDTWIAAQATRVNALNKLFVDTVRATNGNNSTRLLCLAVAEYNQHQHLSKLTLPEDNYLMVQIHSYGELEGSTDSDSTYDADFNYTTETDTLFTDVATFKSSHPDVPVIVGEVGISHSTEITETVKAQRVAYFYQKAAENGVPCLWWEDYFPVTDEGRDHTYWIYDKSKQEWGRTEILAAIKANAKTVASSELDNPTPLTSPTFPPMRGTMRLSGMQWSMA